MNQQRQKRIYIGNGKESKNGGIKANICLDDITLEGKRHHNNGKTYVSAWINRNKQPDKYGNTHSITLDLPQTQQGGAFVPNQTRSREDDMQADRARNQQPEPQAETEGEMVF